MPTLLEETIKGITSYNNATYQFEYLRGHPPLNNPPAQVDFMRNKIIELFGIKAAENIDPKMGGEDFSYYLEKIKGAFAFLGSGNLEKGTSHPLHSSRFMLDEDVLSMGPALFTAIACS